MTAASWSLNSGSERGTGSAEAAAGRSSSRASIKLNPTRFACRPLAGRALIKHEQRLGRGRCSGALDQDDDHKKDHHQNRPEKEDIAGHAWSRAGARFRGGFYNRRVGVARVSHFALVTKSLFPRPTRRMEPCSGLCGGYCRGVEKQRLGDRRLDRRALERLGDQECRLRAGSRGQPLGEGGGEDYRGWGFGGEV